MADAKLGEWTETKDATEETQKLCEKVKGLVEAKTMKIHNEFKPVKYRMIVGEIYKYAIRVQVGGSSYLHLHICQKILSIGGKTELVKVEQNCSKDYPNYPF